MPRQVSSAKRMRYDRQKIVAVGRAIAIPNIMRMESLPCVGSKCVLGKFMALIVRSGDVGNNGRRMHGAFRAGKGWQWEKNRRASLPAEEDPGVLGGARRVIELQLT